MDRTSASPQRLNAAQRSAHIREVVLARGDRKSTRLNSSHVESSYAVFCLKKKSDALVVQLLGELGGPVRQGVGGLLELLCSIDEPGEETGGGLATAFDIVVQGCGGVVVTR